MFSHLLTILLPMVWGIAQPAADARSGPEVEILRLDADPLRGRLTAIDDAGVELQSDGGTQRVPFEAMLAIEPTAPRTGAPAEPQAFVETTDGSSLLASQAECNADRVALVRPDGAKLELPRAGVRSLRFRALDDALLAQWNEAVEATDVADRVIVEREGALDFLEGVVEHVGPEKVRFRLDDELRELPRAKLTGVAFHRSALPESQASQPLLGRLIDRHGAVAAFTKIRPAADGLHVEAASGWSADWPWSDVRRLDFSTGKLLTLTDLAPERIRFTPDPLWTLPGAAESIHDAFGPRFDRGFDGGPLALGGRTFARGIAARGRSEITYRLPEGYRRFTATVGIDDHHRPRGDAVLTLRADEQTLSKSRLTGNDPPTALDLTIADHHRLTIVVESGQHGDVADVVLVVNPRLSK